MGWMENLAENFNKLLGIEVGYFGQTKKGPPGAGTERRHAREAAKRKWQAGYYADTPAAKTSRQVRRRHDRLVSKPMTSAEYGRRKMAAIHAGKKRKQAEGKEP